MQSYENQPGRSYRVNQVPRLIVEIILAVSSNPSNGPIKYLIGLLVLGTLAFSILVNSMLDRIRVGGPIYASIVEQKEFIAGILPPPKYIVESYLIALQMVNKNHRNEIDVLEAKVKKLYREFEDRQLYWSEHLGNDRIRDLLVIESKLPAEDFFEIAFQKILPMTGKPCLTSHFIRCQAWQRNAKY